MKPRDETVRIRELAAAYTPEWRFKTEQPDLGSGLALLFADFMKETFEALDELPKSHQIRFFNCLGAEKKSGTPAGGYMTFDLVKPDMPVSPILKGTGIEGCKTDGRKVQFETLEEVAVSPARVDPEPYREGNALYLRFDRALTGPLHSLLAVVRTGGEGERRLCWEYESAAGFCPVPVEDGTRQLSCTGMLRFTKIPGMAERSREGKTGFWMRVWEERERPFACQVRFYLNGAAVKAREGGSDKNLPPMSSLSLMKTAGFVSLIRNPDVLYGGTDGESGEDTLKRLSAGIRHRGQAVTSGDLEDLSVEASLNIQKVKCFSGFNVRGERAPGYVTLAVLQKDYEDGRSYFYRLKEELMKALRMSVSPCLAETGRLDVTAPWFVFMDVDITVAARESASIPGLTRDIGSALTDYLNPVSGGSDKKGWDFGSLPGHSQVKHMIQRLESVSYVKRLGISLRLEAVGEQREVSFGEVADLPWVLPVSGRHEVTVTFENA